MWPENYYVVINGKKHFLDDSPVTLAIARRALTTAGIARVVVWYNGCETPMSITSDKPVQPRPAPKLRLIQGGKQ